MTREIKGKVATSQPKRNAHEQGTKITKSKKLKDQKKGGCCNWALIAPYKNYQILYVCVLLQSHHGFVFTDKVVK